jgi:hypothetical protein
MHIQLFISEQAPEGDRLLAVLRDAMPGAPFIQYHTTGAVGRVIPAAYNEKAVAVIMVAGRDELAALARRENTWDRLKTILVLPDSESETVSLAHTLRPSYIAFSGSCFADVVAILNHIRESADGAVYN